MYPSYELLCHVPTQSLFNNKISMMRKCSTFSENGYGPATPLRYTLHIAHDPAGILRFFSTLQTS